MEVAASGLAVVSLAIQLFETVDKVKKFVRDVQGAPEELQRLASSLDSLARLIQEVKDLIVVQSQSTKTPIDPGQAFSHSLSSCGACIQPLSVLVDRLAPSRQSSSARLWSSFRTGLKQKDIKTFEENINREIVKLTAALTLNNNRIHLEMHAGIMQLNQSFKSLHLQMKTDIFPSPSASTSPTAMTAIHQSSVATQGRRKVKRTSTHWLWGFKFHQRTTTIWQVANNEDGIPTATIAFRERTTYIPLALLGYGIEWTQRTCYGNVAPSLRVYSLVKEFGEDVKDLFEGGSLSDVQAAFTSGTIHPLIQDEYHGENLLHLTAKYRRYDLYRLLKEMGVPTIQSSHGKSPLGAYLFRRASMPEKNSDFLRLMLEDDQAAPRDFIIQSSNTNWSVFLAHMEELWTQRQVYLEDETLARFENTYFLSFMSHLGNKKYGKIAEDILRRRLTPSHWRTMQRSDVYQDIVLHCNEDAAIILSDILENCGIDLNDTYGSIGKLLPKHGGTGVWMAHPVKRGWKFSLGQGSSGKRYIHWHTWYYPDSAVYDLVTIFPHLTVENDYSVIWSNGDVWPFVSFQEGPFYEYLRKEKRRELKRIKRQQRRAERTAQKENGTWNAEVFRAKIPGAWID